MSQEQVRNEEIYKCYAKTCVKRSHSEMIYKLAQINSHSFQSVNAPCQTYALSHRETVSRKTYSKCYIQEKDRYTIYVSVPNIFFQTYIRIYEKIVPNMALVPIWGLSHQTDQF